MKQTMVILVLLMLLSIPFASAAPQGINSWALQGVVTGNTQDIAHQGFSVSTTLSTTCFGTSDWSPPTMDEIYYVTTTIDRAVSGTLQYRWPGNNTVIWDYVTSTGVFSSYHFQSRLVFLGKDDGPNPSISADDIMTLVVEIIPSSTAATEVACEGGNPKQWHFEVKDISQQIFGWVANLTAGGNTVGYIHKPIGEPLEGEVASIKSKRDLSQPGTDISWERLNPETITYNDPSDGGAKTNFDTAGHFFVQKLTIDPLTQPIYLSSVAFQHNGCSGSTDGTKLYLSISDTFDGVTWNNSDERYNVTFNNAVMTGSGTGEVWTTWNLVTGAVVSSGGINFGAPTSIVGSPAPSFAAAATPGTLYFRIFIDDSIVGCGSGQVQLDRRTSGGNPAWSCTPGCSPTGALQEQVIRAYGATTYEWEKTFAINDTGGSLVTYYREEEVDSVLGKIKFVSSTDGGLVRSGFYSFAGIAGAPGCTVTAPCTHDEGRVGYIDIPVTTQNKDITVTMNVSESGRNIIYTGHLLDPITNPHRKFIELPPEGTSFNPLRLYQYWTENDFNFTHLLTVKECLELDLTTGQCSSIGNVLSGVTFTATLPFRTVEGVTAADGIATLTGQDLSGVFNVALSKAGYQSTTATITGSPVPGTYTATVLMIADETGISVEQDQLSALISIEPKQKDFFVPEPAIHFVNRTGAILEGKRLFVTIYEKNPNTGIAIQVKSPQSWTTSSLTHEFPPRPTLDDPNGDIGAYFIVVSDANGNFLKGETFRICPSNGNCTAVQNATLSDSNIDLIEQQLKTQVPLLSQADKQQDEEETVRSVVANFVSWSLNDYILIPNMVWAFLLALIVGLFSRTTMFNPREP